MNPQLAMAWGSHVAARMPRGVAEGVSDILARLAATLPSGGVRHLRANLGQVLPEVPPGIVRGAVRHYARYYLEMMRLSRAGLEQAVGPVQWQGDTWMQESLQHGRGAVVLSAHLGNWDLAGMALARRFGAVTVYVERLHPPEVFEFYRRTRRRQGCDVVTAGSGSRAAVRTLRRNGIVGIVADRSFGAPAQRVSFGSGALDVPTGGIRLALHQDAALHTIFCVRRAAGYTCILQPELLPDRSGGDDLVRRAAAGFAERLQLVVRAHPDQWCLMHPTSDPHREDT